jgi:hypothetical protein
MPRLYRAALIPATVGLQFAWRPLRLSRVSITYLTTGTGVSPDLPGLSQGRPESRRRQLRRPQSPRRPQRRRAHGHRLLRRRQSRHRLLRRRQNRHLQLRRRQSRHRRQRRRRRQRRPLRTNHGTRTRSGCPVVPNLPAIPFPRRTHSRVTRRCTRQTLRLRHCLLAGIPTRGSPAATRVLSFHLAPSR